MLDAVVKAARTRMERRGVVDRQDRYDLPAPFLRPLSALAERGGFWRGVVRPDEQGVAARTWTAEITVKIYGGTLCKQMARASLALW